MKYLILSLATLINFANWAQPGANFSEDLRLEEYQQLADYGTFSQIVLTDSSYDSSIGQGESIYCFTFDYILVEDLDTSIQYSIDSINYTGTLQANKLYLKTTPGVHFFQFYINMNYMEVFSGGLTIKPHYKNKYNIALVRRAPQEPILTYKPVIYLYPKEETEVDVNLEIHDGKHPFYYPAYNENWTCTASPNGDLSVNGEQFRYLFWEAQQNDHLTEIEVNEGFVVEGKDAISFLESHLNNFGFTAAERADFITFWGPKLASNEQNLVRFEWNEACDKFADLNVSPQPDHMYRFYIFMSALEADYEIQPQIIPTMKRDGFTVLEWGGQVSNFQPTKVL